MIKAITTFRQDVKFAVRSLARSTGLTLTVVLTLALGIGANAAIFTLVRGVLLRPLVNRDENRLIYVRQSAPGIGPGDVPFSVPEIDDLRAGVKTVNAFGEFSAIGFTMVGLGEPREIRAGVVDGSYFDVVGLHPVLGRLLDMRDDGPKAAGAMVLTYRFWTTQLGSDPSVLGKTVRAGTVDTVPRVNRDHRQHRHQPASSVGDHGDRPGPSDDGSIRAARARRDSGTGARRAARGVRCDASRTSRGVSGAVALQH
jgi:putative ABC transport system permease protein